MKITAIKAQVKNPDRVSIFVDGTYSFSLTLSELIEHRLKKDQEIDHTQQEALVKVSLDGKTRARALEWVLGRVHSQKELRDYLYRKKVDPELAGNIAADFVKRGYVDDQRFAKHFCEIRLKKGKSKRFVTQELRAKGVDPQIISEVLEGEDEQLKVLIQKKQHLSRYRDDRKKFIAYLIGQGYAYSSVVAALAEFDNEG